MGVYGNWAEDCPTDTFTEEALLKNFPDSTAEPWEVLDTWGNTEHNSYGFVFQANQSVFSILRCVQTLPQLYGIHT